MKRKGKEKQREKSRVTGARRERGGGLIWQIIRRKSVEISRICR